MEPQARNVSLQAPWDGWLVHDCRGSRIGTLVATREMPDGAAWYLIRLARFSSRFALAPPANLLAGSGHVWLPYARETVEQSPLLFAVPDAVDRPLERRLRAHYRLGGDAPPDVRVRVGRTPA